MKMKAQRGIRVLIVEDEALVAEMVQALLERSGYVVVGRAAEGVQAIEMTQSLRPDVVLMDIALSGMDGLEAVRRIYDACPTPVVVLTAYETPELVERASAVGVGAYLVKPPRARELERAITITMARFGDLVTLRRLNAELYAEVAEHKRAEEALKDSQRRYQSLFEDSPIPVWEQDFSAVREALEKLRDARVSDFYAYFRDHPEAVKDLLARVRVLDLNKAVLKLHRAQSKEQLLNNLPGVFVEETYKVFALELALIAEGETMFDLEEMVRTLDDESRCVMVRWVAADGYESTLSRVLVSVIDITERVRTEETLQQTQQLLTSLLEYAPVPIYVTSEDNHYRLVNRAWEDFARRERDQAIGHSLEDVFPAEIACQFKDINQQVIATAVPVITEDFADAPDGRHYFHTVKFPLRDAAGRVEAVGGISIDITQRKAAEESLHRRAAQLALINDIGNRIAAVLNLDEVMGRAARLVQESFGYHHVALFAVDREQGELVMMARAGDFAGLFPPAHRIKLGQGMVGWVACHDERVLANDVRTEPRYVNFYPDLIPTRAELCVPIRVGQETVGALDVQSPRINAFDENDVMVMETLADQIAVAIENARLYEAVQKELAERRRVEEALRRREQEFFTLVENAPDMIVRFDADLHHLYCNAAVKRQLGVPARVFLGKTPLEAAGPTAQAEFVTQSLWKVLETGGEQEVEQSYPTPFGLKHFQTHIVPERNAQGRVESLLAITRDITERKQAEERIRREAARTGALARVASILNAQLDLNKVLDAVCRETARALNVPATSVTLYDPDRSVLSLVSAFGLPPEISERFAPMPRSRYDEYALRGDPFIVVPDVEAARGLPHTTPFVHRDFRTAAVASLMREGQLIGTLNIHVEGEQRVFDENELALLKGLTDEAAQAIANAQLFEQVRQQRQQLRALSARLAEAEEAERRRLARELHDEVGQTLTALGINLNIMRAQMPGELSDAVRSRLEDSLALVEQTTERVRSVMAELRPPVLDDYGLVAALRWYGMQFSSRTGVAVEVQGEEITPRLAAPVESALFRITQEALNNVIRHAQASRVRVAVESDGETTRLVIADDGIGFDLAQRAAPSEHGGWGVMSMSERAEAVGGHCSIESRPGQGTRVVVEVSR